MCFYFDQKVASFRSIQRFSGYSTLKAGERKAKDGRGSEEGGPAVQKLLIINSRVEQMFSCQ